jgi:hypothetical protein
MRYFFDTKKLMTWCGCGAMGIDACLLVSRGVRVILGLLWIRIIQYKLKNSKK